MQQTAKALLISLAVGLSLPAHADRHDDGYDRRDGYEHEHHHHDHHDRDRYERERYGMDRSQYDQGYRQGCRIEGWYDRDGYYRERRVCPEPAAVISIPVPLPPGLPLPPGVRFR